MTKPELDKHSPEYFWWSQGAADEAKARDEGLNPMAKEVREMVEVMGRFKPDWGKWELIASIARIYCPAMLRRKWRNDK